MHASKLLESSSSRSGKLERRCEIGNYTNTGDLVERVKLSSYLFIVLLNLLPLRQKSLRKEEIISQPQVAYFQKQVKIFTQEEITL